MLRQLKQHSVSILLIALVAIATLCIALISFDLGRRSILSEFSALLPGSNTSAHYDTFSQPNNTVKQPQVEYPAASLPVIVNYPHELQPGVQICFINYENMSNHNYVVNSVVHLAPRGEDKGGLMEVVRLQDASGTVDSITLAELGILAYPMSGSLSDNLTLLGACPDQA